VAYDYLLIASPLRSLFRLRDYTFPLSFFASSYSAAGGPLVSLMPAGLPRLISNTGFYFHRVDFKERAGNRP
jgi:hypothetical protein